MKIKNHKPKAIGKCDLKIDEFMLWQYVPISLKGEMYCDLPCYNLIPTLPLIKKIQNYVGTDFFIQHNVYLTIKSNFLSPNCYQNREGWHIDGFMSHDINFIWYNNLPTEFMTFKGSIQIPEDHEKAIEYFEEIKDYQIQTYEPKTILELTPFIIHRPQKPTVQMNRVFIKISFSQEKYNLLGNNKNHNLNYKWKMHPRKKERNHPFIQR